MNIKTLLGARVLVNPEVTEAKSAGGIILPQAVDKKLNTLRYGVIALKGTGTPDNDMAELHVKHRVSWRNGAGIPWEGLAEDGTVVNQLILNADEVYLEE